MPTTAPDITKRLALALRAAITDCSHGGDVEARCARCIQRWRLIDEAGGVDAYPRVISERGGGGGEHSARPADAVPAAPVCEGRVIERHLRLAPQAIPAAGACGNCQRRPCATWCPVGRPLETHPLPLVPASEGVDAPTVPSGKEA